MKDTKIKVGNSSKFTVSEFLSKFFKFFSVVFFDPLVGLLCFVFAPLCVHSHSLHHPSSVGQNFISLLDNLLHYVLTQRRKSISVLFV